MKLAKGSASWILTSLVLGLLFLVLSIFFERLELKSVLIFISLVCFLLVIFFMMFFRDPERKIGKHIVACADGKIREITELKDDDIGKCICISTFMNVHNVHVNRMSIDGKIISIKHYSGLHIPAFKKESEKNERVVIIADTNIGKIKIVQIAGTLARRIVPYVKKDDELKKGDKIGIIRLGSRVDVYLPVKKINVKVGDIVRAGVDTIAEIDD